MKYAAILLAFLCLTIFQPGQQKAAPRHDSNTREQPSANPPNQTITIYNQPSSKEQNGGENQHQDEIGVERQLAKFTWYLVLVGLLQSAILFGQGVLFLQQRRIMHEHKISLEQLASAAENNVIAIRTQGETMESQLRAMDRQVAAVETQNATLRESVAIAQASVEAVIEKERARIRIPVGDIIVQTTLNSTTCYLANYGPTPAFIEDFKARMLYCLPKDIAPDYSLCRQILYAESIQPNSRTSTTVLIPLEFGALQDSLSENDVMKIKKEEAFIHFYGIVKYRDVFRRKRQATIHLLWKMRWGGTREGMIMQWWEPVGEPTENTDE